MPIPMPLVLRRLPPPLRRRIEVSAAMSWEALVDAHAANGVELVLLLAGAMPLGDIIDRYIKEMDIAPAMVAAVRNRILATLEREREPILHVLDGDGAPSVAQGWRRLRPDVVLRAIRNRTRRREETDRLLELALARAEEVVITTHVENAAAFADLLEPRVPLHQSLQEYLRYLVLGGGRAQAVTQRAMARLADERLPPRNRRRLLRGVTERPHA